DLHFAALLQRRRDGVESRVDGGSSRGLRHLGLVGHRSDELVLGHLTDPFPIESTAHLPLWARSVAGNRPIASDSFHKVQQRRRIANANQPRMQIPSAFSRLAAAMSGACRTG